MLEIRRLRLLRELSIRGTLAGVADALAYSPSSVSQQLALLEKEVGVELMRKSGRGVLLTPQAQLLAEHTGELLDAFERAEAAVAASQDEIRGTVRMAVFQSAMLALLPATLQAGVSRSSSIALSIVARTSLKQNGHRNSKPTIAVPVRRRT